MDEAHLLLDARAANRAHGITGHLHREGDTFVQYFEGEEAAVRQLFFNISRDTRHEDLTTLAEMTIAARLYSGWAMGFSDLSASGASKIGETPDDVLRFFGLIGADRQGAG